MDFTANNPAYAGMTSAEIAREKTRCINILKRLFMTLAKEKVAPQFRITSANRQTVADLFRWCIADKEGPYDPAKGLWLYGSVGSGKTTLLKVVREFCRQVRAPLPDGRPYSFGIIGMSDITTAFSEDSYRGLNEKADLMSVAYDDIGTETLTAMRYGAVETLVPYILQRRYDRRLPTHATSNIGPDRIREIYGDRVYDRCREMFNFVPLQCPTFRR